MRGTTHLLIGASVVLPLAVAADSWERPAILATGALAALLPDIDHPHSLLGRIIPWPAIEQRQGRFIKEGRRGFSGPIWHRDQLHSLGFAGIVVALIWITQLLTHATLTAAPEALFLAAAGLGFVSHLAADAINSTPQMLLWPLSHARMRPPLPPIPQASLLGRTLEMACTLGSVYLIWKVAIPLF